MTNLLEHYNKELHYLRKLGEAFARQHPAVASRLRLGEFSEDPHIERLIQCSAFLTAHVRQKLEDQFPEIVHGMLEVLEPGALAPIPSMAIAQVHVASGSGAPSKMVHVPSSTMLTTHVNLEDAPQPSECHFRTCYPIDVWPIQLESAELNGPPFSLTGTLPADVQSVLTLRFAWTTKKQAPVPGLARLRCYLSGEFEQVEALYELLFSSSPRVVVGNELPAGRAENHLRLEPVGFDSAASLRGRSARIPYAHELMGDFFSFPRKFLFFDLVGLDDQLSASDGDFTINVLLTQRRRTLEVSVDKEIFQLNCTPVINLFPQRAQPIRLSHERYEYPIVPDIHRRPDVEVYSIDKVSTIGSDGKSVEFAPMYSLRHDVADDTKPLFWATRRTQRWNETLRELKTMIYLSLVNASFQADTRELEESTLLVETTCTNGNLPAHLPFGRGILQLRAEKGTFKTFNFLTRPTPLRRTDHGQTRLWQLVSNLTLNHLSIVQPRESQPQSRGQDVTQGHAQDRHDPVAALRQVLNVYTAGSTRGKFFPLEDIIDVTSRQCAQRTSEKSIRGRTHASFYRGLEVTLTVRRDRFVGHGLYLFASVLERFFALYSSLNSFTKTTVRFEHEEGVWSWPSRSGERLV